MYKELNDGLKGSNNASYYRLMADHCDYINTYSRHLDNVLSEQTYWSRELTRLGASTYEKIVICNRLYFLNCLEVLYYDTDMIGDEDVEDMYDTFRDIFTALEALINKYDNNEADKKDFVKPVLKYAEDLDKLVTGVDGGSKLTYAYLRSEIDYALRYCEKMQRLYENYKN